MKHAIEHDLPPDEARAAAREAVEHYRQRFAKYDPTVTWVDDDHARVAFDAKGMKVEARIALVPRAIEIELDVPWAFRVFQGTAKKVLETELRSFLAARKASAAKSRAVA